MAAAFAVAADAPQVLAPVVLPSVGGGRKAWGCSRDLGGVFDPAEEGGGPGSIVSLSGTLSLASPCRWKDHIYILFSKFFHLALANVPTLRPFRDSLQTKLKHLLFSSKASLGAFLRRGPSPHAATALGAQQSRRLREAPACTVRNCMSFPAGVSPRNTTKPTLALRRPIPRCSDPILVWRRTVKRVRFTTKTATTPLSL